MTTVTTQETSKKTPKIDKSIGKNLNVRMSEEKVQKRQLNTAYSVKQIAFEKYNVE